MKKLMIIICCILFSIPCYSMEPYMQRLIDDVNASTRRNNMIAYRLDKSADIFGGMVKLGLAYWGFKQNNGYGNVTGVLFAISGTAQIILLKF